MSKFTGLLFTTAVMCLLIPTEAVLTKFEMTGQVFCKWAIPKASTKRLYSLQLWESDGLFYNKMIGEGDDYLKQNITMNSTAVYNYPYYYRIDAEESGDGIGFEYELYFVLDHDCNPWRGRELKIVEASNSFSVVDGTLYGKDLINSASRLYWGRKRRSNEKHRRNIEKLRQIIELNRKK